MRWHADVCKDIPGGETSAVARRLCWGIFLDFIRQLATKATNLPASDGEPMGWMQDRTPETGLRVTVYGFACMNNQNTAVTKVVGLNLESSDAFEAALTYAENYITPDGGTCPHQAIDDVVADMETYDLLRRPLKSVVIITDGVFYDQKLTQRAAKGLRYYCAQIFALALPGGEHGTSMVVEPAQEAELLAIVGTTATSPYTGVYNFGVNGFGLLDEISTLMVSHMPGRLGVSDPSMAQCLAKVVASPVWCHFTTVKSCNNYQSGDCQWVNGKCTYLKPGVRALAALAAAAPQGADQL